ncbi:hypothetical protein HMPREF0645_0619 [Hallella bergensis DSM 17361]|uniref:Uncharacterized protein n=1 Tax=Hallella bergensis DSM 17361 TaxID=585502 RepID=D1PUI4_9BACT|nr:hypothetical protein HMPREF0645_0619 [Hallella bergensis DSM 17361]
MDFEDRSMEVARISINKKSFFILIGYHDMGKDLKSMQLAIRVVPAWAICLLRIR